jgi:hypothetical protein
LKYVPVMRKRFWNSPDPARRVSGRGIQPA